MNLSLITGDCLEKMKHLPDNSVDSIVTDPPYGIKFMSKKWDYSIPSVEVWTEAMRVLKPGGHMLCACGTRTYHRMACNIEDAGFEMRDAVSNLFSHTEAFDALWDSFSDEQKKLYGAIHQENTVLWVYGSGFPKSLNVSKAIDKAVGAERKQTPVGEPVKRMIPGADQDKTGSWIKDNGREYQPCVEEPATDEAKQWDGWGTALKPACEFFTLARKPLSEKTIAANVLRWGTGGINVDGCRVDGVPHHNYGRTCAGGIYTGQSDTPINTPAQGRFPANLILDGSPEVVDGFPVTKPSKKGKPRQSATPGDGYGMTHTGAEYDDQGSAARFFYCAKASKKDRNEGLEGMPVKVADPYGEHRGRRMDGDATRIDGKPPSKGQNNHPTVKPTELMRYLCRLITPPGGTVLDPFMGSGSTGKAAVLEGFHFTGIELEADYVEISRNRIGAVL